MLYVIMIALLNRCDMLQLEFFEKDNVNLLLKEIRLLKESQASMRKALFARHDILEREVKSLKKRKAKRKPTKQLYLFCA